MIPVYDVVRVLWLFVPAYFANIAPGATWPVFDQLDFFAGAYLFVSPVYVPALPATLMCLPLVLIGSVAMTAIGWALGLKQAWI